MRFLSQFNNTLVYVLLGAASIKTIMGEWLDASVIMAVVIINAVIGFIQEGRRRRRSTDPQDALRRGRRARREAR